MDGDTAVFVRQVRSRTCENGEAIRVLLERHLFGPLVATIRLELDSFIRVVYLAAIGDLDERRRLIVDAIHGRKWRLPNGKKLFERTMVEYATQPHSWVRDLYDFGCAFVHLSNGHDYLARDPFRSLSVPKRVRIAKYLADFYGADVDDTSSFEEIARYSVQVFEKMKNNAEGYLRAIEEGRVLERGAA